MILCPYNNVKDFYNGNVGMSFFINILLLSLIPLKANTKQIILQNGIVFFLLIDFIFRTVFNLQISR